MKETRITPEQMEQAFELAKRPDFWCRAKLFAALHAAHTKGVLQEVLDEIGDSCGNSDDATHIHGAASLIARHLEVHWKDRPKVIQTSKQLRGDMAAAHNRSHYDVVFYDDGAVWIVDRFDTPEAYDYVKALSVTNDADGVCAELALHYGGRQIYYRDTEGRWD